MARRRETEGLPEMPEGLTLAECAVALSGRFGRHVTAKQVHYVALRRGVARRIGKKRVAIARMDEVLAVHPEELERIAAAIGALYLDAGESAEVD